MKVGKLGWLVAMFLSGGMAVAQGTVDDYRRAYALKEKFSADKVFYSNVNPQWIEGTHQGRYLQPIITQYFIDNKSEIWLLFLIAHSKR